MNISKALLQGDYSLTGQFLGEHKKSQNGPKGTSAVLIVAHSRAKGQPLRRHYSD